MPTGVKKNDLSRRIYATGKGSLRPRTRQSPSAGAQVKCMFLGICVCSKPAMARAKYRVAIEQPVMASLRKQHVF